MRKVIRSAEARSDLNQIFNYIADHSSEDQAAKFLKVLEATIQKLRIRLIWEQPVTI